MHGVQDCSRGNTYHNKKFKECAEAHGLEVAHHERYGWTVTTPSLELLDFIEGQGWTALNMVEGLGWTVTGTGSGTGRGAENGAEKPPKKPSSTRKYVCPICGNSCRATKALNLICGDCMETMVVSE